MHIEISAGGLGVSVTGFQSDFQGYLSNAESMIASFKSVKNSVLALNGGVENLQDALDNVEARIQKEETAKQQAKAIQQKISDFVSLAERVDKQVADTVNQNRDELYRVSPWLKPAPEPEEKAWYEKAWDWLCSAGEAIVEGAAQVWSYVTDTASKAWNGLVEFYEENKLELINFAVTAICIIGSTAAILLIPVTGGASIALIAGVSALSAAIIAGTRNLTTQYAENGSLDNVDWNSFTQEVLISGIVGALTGGLGAWVGGTNSAGLATTSYGATLLNSSNAFIRTLTGAGIGSISQVLTGVLTRFTGRTIENYLKTGCSDIADVWNWAIDFHNILFDFSIGAVTGGYAAKNNPIGKEYSLEDLNNNKLLETKPYKSPAVDKWINQKHGKIFIDGNGTWTFMLPDGTHVCYSNSLPDFDRAGLVIREYKVPGGFNNTNHNIDINNAVKATGVGKGDGFTWHHYEDLETLKLIPTKYHQAFTHRGGFAISKGR